MLENLYTTKMSMDKQKLQNRFAKIRSKNGGLSKMMAVTSAAMIVMAVLCSFAVMAAFGGLDSYDIKIYLNDEPVKLEHKPFFYENSVYVPLREMSSFLGNNEIQWDNGKITIYVDGDEDFYELNIGSNQIKVEAVSPKINAMGVNEERNALVLMNDTTYVPFEIINFIYNRKSAAHDIYYKFGDIVSNAPYMDNVEFLSYEDIQYLQFNVDNGHISWRIDAIDTIKDYLMCLKGMEDGRLTEMKKDGASYSATYSVGASSYYIELFKPAKQGSDGIWIVKKFYNTNPPYTKDEIEDAKEVVRKYLEALEKRDRETVLSMLDSLYDTPNAKLWHDEKIVLNSIEPDLTDSLKNGYMQWRKDAGMSVLPENIIVLTANLTIEVYGEAPHTGGEYKGYSYVLIRDGKDGQWRINGMGYFV